MFLLFQAADHSFGSRKVKDALRSGHMRSPFAHLRLTRSCASDSIRLREVQKDLADVARVRKLAQRCHRTAEGVRKALHRRHLPPCQELARAREAALQNLQIVASRCHGA